MPRRDQSIDREHTDVLMIAPHTLSGMSTLLCVPILVQSVESALSDAAAARAGGADLVEFRIDGFESDDQNAVATQELITLARTLVKQSPLSCIITCRLATEAGGIGGYNGPDRPRLDVMDAVARGISTSDVTDDAANIPPRFVDVELASFKGTAKSTAMNLAANLASAADVGGVESSLIVSFHDFAGRPADFSRRVLDACAAGGAVVKVVYRARSLRDSLELLDLPEQLQRPTIALGVGEFGLLSRLLAPKFGSFLTFAALRPASTTAPGQPTLAEILGTYRFRAVRASTKVYGIIGWPVTQSLSPATHNRWFDELSYDGVYVPLPIACEDASDAPLALKATLLELIGHSKLTLCGASVTIPYKEALVSLAKEQKAAGEPWFITPVAAAIGAANTVVIERTSSGKVAKVTIDNTDAPAITDALIAAGVILRSCRALVVGAGGAGRAAAHALANVGAEVYITNRDRDRAAALSSEINDSKVLDWNQRNTFDGDVIVQCTPLGMKDGPAPDQSPVALASLPSRPVVFDTVYNPAITPLLREAQALGLVTISGKAMFDRQAKRQFEMWTA